MMSIPEENLNMILAAIEACGIRNLTITVDKINDEVRVTLSNGEFLTIDRIAAHEMPPEMLSRFIENWSQGVIDAGIELGSKVSELAGKNGVSAKNNIVRPPGTTLLMWAEFVFSLKKYERVLHPTIADMREEYYEALHRGEMWKARWIHVRGLWSFWAAVLTDIPISVFGLVKRLWTAAS